MSITSCLFLILLCFSLHYSCNARRFGPVDKKFEKKYQFSISKNDEKKGFPEKIPVLPKVRLVRPSLSGEAEATKLGDSTKKTRLDANTQRPKQTKGNEKIVSKAERGKLTSNAVKPAPAESLVSVSWRVPKKKRGGKHPGFNLDYSPPKTHPPSHN